MIEIVWGPPGAGKTVYAAWRIIQARREGQRVIANFHPTAPGHWEFGLWRQMVDSEDSLCVVDEGHRWFNCRSWQRNGEDDLGVFQQSRKDGLDLLVISQHYERVDLVIRQCCHWYYRCRPIGPTTRYGRFFSVHRHTIEGDKKSRDFGRKLFFASAKWWDAYLTEERIGRADGRGYGLGRSSRYGRLRYRVVLPHGEVSYLTEDQLRALRVPYRSCDPVMIRPNGRVVPVPLDLLTGSVEALYGGGGGVPSGEGSPAVVDAVEDAVRHSMSREFRRRALLAGERN